MVCVIQIQYLTAVARVGTRACVRRAVCPVGPRMSALLLQPEWTAGGWCRFDHLMLRTGPYAAAKSEILVAVVSRINPVESFHTIENYPEHSLPSKKRDRLLDGSPMSAPFPGYHQCRVGLARQRQSVGERRNGR